MTRGKILAATLGIAAVGMTTLGLSSTPASADRYCGPGYHWAAGYCYPHVRPYYYPPAYYAPPAPVVVAPSVGFSFGFGGGHYHHWHR
jgi:hypothetical protein